MKKKKKDGLPEERTRNRNHRGDDAWASHASGDGTLGQRGFGRELQQFFRGAKRFQVAERKILEHQL